MIDIKSAIETAKRLRELAGKATPGDWKAEGYRHRTTRLRVRTADNAATICQVTALIHKEANAAFTAAARNDTPALCDAVESLARENERLLRLLQWCKPRLRTVGYQECLSQQIANPVTPDHTAIVQSGAALAER